MPRSKRLLSDGGSNVLVYLAGHGGDDFMKFQDQEEIMGQVGGHRVQPGRGCGIVTRFGSAAGKGVALY